MDFIQHFFPSLFGDGFPIKKRLPSREIHMDSLYIVNHHGEL
jgi:hypothetical protein